MKKLVLLLSAFLFGSFVVSAQDMITKKDGTDIEAKVLEVTQDEVKYVKVSNPDGPTYLLNKKDVLLIRYENGEKEIFSESTISPNVSPRILDRDLTYKELVQKYDFHDYSPSFGDRYSVGWCGVASAFIPGLGQAICNEWGHAAGFFFGNAVLAGAGSYLVYKSYIDYYPQFEYDVIGAIVCYTLAAGLDIWGIIDAVRVAKVKNLYYQDIRGQYSLNVKMYPSIQNTPSAHIPSVTIALAF